MLLALTILLLTCAAISAAGVHTNRPNQDMFRGHRKGDQSWQWNWQAWLPDKWARIGACETGYGQRPGRWDWNSGIYQGAFGFYYGTWDAYKPVKWWPDEAYLASPWQQYQTALAVYRVHGYGAWGCGGA